MSSTVLAGAIAQAKILGEALDRAPLSYAARQARRCTFPEVVLGMAPARAMTTA